MATIDVGGHGGKRTADRSIPLVPFIDFLLCLIAFLLVTAVWSQKGLLNADALVPGDPVDAPPSAPNKERQLHVDARGASFKLEWREGNKVLSSLDVPKQQRTVGNQGDHGYPELGQKIQDEWRANGSHRAASDLKLDQAVLHTDNSTPFADVIAVIDAVHTPKREWRAQKVPAFNVSFAVN